MDARYDSFLQYIKQCYKRNIDIIQEKQAVQISLPMNDNGEVVYDIVFKEECIDKVYVIAFWGYINYLTKELFVEIGRCNELSADCTYVVHKTKKGTILRVTKEVPAFSDNNTRNLRIMEELKDMHREIENNINRLISLWN